MIVRPPEQRHRPTNQGCRNIGTKWWWCWLICSSLSKTLPTGARAGEEALPHLTEESRHCFKPGDWVVVVNVHTIQVVEYTPGGQTRSKSFWAVKVPGRGPWIHVHHCKWWTGISLAFWRWGFPNTKEVTEGTHLPIGGPNLDIIPSLEKEDAVSYVTGHTDDNRLLRWAEYTARQHSHGDC